MYFELQTNSLEDSEGVLDLVEEPTEFFRILVVDDDAVDRLKLRRLAESLDFPVKLSEANNLTGLRDQLELWTFDLILLDYRLGAGDGLDALSIIRNHAENKDTAVVMISGMADMEVAISALKSGCDNYIPKDNLDADVLRSAMLEVLDREHARINGEQAADAQETTDAVMALISQHCIDNMRPILSRMMRQVRQMSSVRHSAAEADYGLMLRQLDQTCGVLWEYFEEFDSYRKQPEPRPN